MCKELKLLLVYMISTSVKIYLYVYEYVASIVLNIKQSMKITFDNYLFLVFTDTVFKTNYLFIFQLLDGN